MTQAFYSGISGLKNYSAGIDVLSDNLANVSTTGFRGSNAEFSSLFEASKLTGASSKNDTVGVGVQLQTTSMMTQQGSLALTDRSTDMAILGNGWFGAQGTGSPIYTRDGNFSIDANADLVTADGLYVLGTKGGNISANDVLTSVLSEIPLGDVKTQEKLRFPKTLTYPPQVTTQAKFIANLGVGTDPITVGAAVIDSQNNKNNLQLEFIKDATQTPPGSQYNVTATVTSPDGKTVYDTKSGKVAFDATGALTLSTLGTIDNNGSPVKMDLGKGYDGIVSIDVPVVPGSSTADGTIGGDLTGYSINKNAEVIATFSNGRQSSVGKIAVYHFQNDQGLNRLSGTRFQESSNSGKPLFYADANGKNIIGSEIVNYKLEGSNVKMSSGLTDLIILQRAYDANSKSVTTADEMIQKALNMHK